MTNELMTTLITAWLIIIPLMVTMLTKKVLRATASAAVTIHLWPVMMSWSGRVEPGESNSSKGRHAAHSFGTTYLCRRTQEHYSVDPITSTHWVMEKAEKI